MCEPSKLYTGQRDQAYCIHAWDNIEKALEASQVACSAKDPAGIRNREACNRHATSACTTPCLYI